MGQARQRGTFEQRLEEAIRRDVLKKKALKDAAVKKPILSKGSKLGEYHE